MAKKIILGSKSPRRISLLKEIGLDFEIAVSGVDERSIKYNTPQELAIKAAFLKAEEVASRFKDGIVISADTIVCIDDKIIGKPKSKDQAREMLKSLSGKKHVVITGLAVSEIGGGCQLDCVKTDVYIKELSDQQIEDYINTDEPYDKAGAYAIQGDAGRFVDHIDGCYHNVVGLPLLRLKKMLSGLIDVNVLKINCVCEKG